MRTAKRGREPHWKTNLDVKNSGWQSRKGVVPVRVGPRFEIWAHVSPNGDARIQDRLQRTRSRDNTFDGNGAALGCLKAPNHEKGRHEESHARKNCVSCRVIAERSCSGECREQLQAQR